jgi:FixJ family two-component response regulator
MTAPDIVHVVDDDASWRKSVGRLLRAAGYQVVLYDSAEQFLQAATTDAPGCMLLDIRMPGLSGLNLQQRLLDDSRQRLPIVFLSGHGDIPTTVLAMKAGAENFLTKPVDTEVLLEAVRKAVEACREDQTRRQRLAKQQACVAALTPTERKVFDLVVRGKLNKQIASELGTVERTIKWHRHNIMEKLQLGSLAELVSLAERHGLAGAKEPPNGDRR